MWKRCLSALLALALALLPAGCGAGGDDASGVTLTVMGKKTDVQKSYLTKMFGLYEQATGNKLKIVSFEDSEFETAAAERFAAGDVPDIFMHFHNSDLDRFNVAENFLDLSGQPWAEELTDSARAYCTSAEGALLGLPLWESSVSGCYYNKTLLDSMGLRPAATQTEFDMLCQALADTGYTPICWPADGCTWMTQFAMDPIFADEPDLLESINSNETTYADIPAMTDMVQWLGSAAKAGWFGDGYMSCGWDDISPALGSGEAVMSFIWDTWFYTDFADGQKYTVDDFALMPVFMGTADEGTYEGGNLNMMLVNKNGDKVDEALAFLAFCADPENYNKAFDGIATVSCFKGQNTNIQSAMVTDAAASIAAHERVSTAATRLVGYSADDMNAALDELFLGRVDVPGCVALMDEYRIEDAGLQGGEGSSTPDPAA